MSPLRQETCDLLVLGSGAGGLSAAVTAAWLGLNVIVVEKEPVFGGSSAWSGGWLWIPRNPLAQAAGIVEGIEGPREYLRHELGNGYDAARVDAFLEHGPSMVAFFEERTAVKFIDGNAIPDFHGSTPGAAQGGRSVCAAPFDGRELGDRIRDLRPPLDLISLWGMGIAGGADLKHFLDVLRSPTSFLHVVRRVGTHLKDLALHRRGMQLVNGNALVARLARSAFDLKVRLWTSSPARALIDQGGHIAGAVVETPAGRVEIRASRGVVLACGGFPHSVRRKRELFPHAPTGEEHWSAAPSGNTGDGLDLGESAGGVVETGLPHAGAWAPVSLVPRADGSVGRFPHLVERGKPGVIAVTAAGRRFVNEADSYHDFMKGLFAAVPDGEQKEAWLICDHRFQRRYGLGFSRPAPVPLAPCLRSGYLKRARTLEELATACGINASGLRATVDRYNEHARLGNDPEFGRGRTPYNRVQGDPDQKPNPCVAPIERAPFYAVKIVPGSLGTFAGMRTDAYARVLDREARPIQGLYAVGNDMASIMAGSYPSGGITLGPAMTFGYIAAHHAAGVPLPKDGESTPTAAQARSPASRHELTS